LLACSPPPDPLSIIPPMLTLKPEPQPTWKRLCTLLRILVPRVFDYQGGRMLALAGLVVARTALSDRIASLNGTSVKNVLQQDRRAFIRLIGISVLQSLASAIVAPSLR
jgi:hypothetical protein